MIRRSLGVALAVVTAVNIAMVIADARNRRGSADSSVELDERELTFVPPPPQGSTLALRWNVLRGATGHEPWLDKSRLVSLGFDCSVAPGDPRAPAHYASQLPRPAFAVLQIGGPEWDRRLASWQERVGREDDSGSAAVPERASRLVAIDAGRDPVALRARYPDRQHTLLVPAVVRIWLDPGRRGGGPAIRGGIGEFLPVEIQPALRERRALRHLTEASRWASSYALSHTPRYRVGVTIGAEFRPYVFAVWPEESTTAK